VLDHVGDFDDEWHAANASVENREIDRISSGTNTPVADHMTAPGASLPEEKDQ
jgi:hypothetical protein